MKGNALRIKQAAALLGVSEQTLRRWDRTGILRARRHSVSGYRLYDRGELETLAKKLGASAESARPAAADPRVELGPTPRTNLTPLLEGFIGRERALEALGATLGRGERIVTVVGPPGVGKTRLARYFAETHAAAFLHAGGVWFCDVTDAAAPDQLAAALFAAVRPRSRVEHGGAGTDAKHAFEQLADVIDAAGACLVIVDNAESLTRPARALLEQLVSRSRELRVLVTSRERLGVPGEHVMELGALELPPETTRTRDEIDRSEAVRLFCERARAAGASWELEPLDVASLVRALDGLPLAIELAAARAPLLSPAELRQRLLDRRLDVLRVREPQPGSLARHATLRAAVEVSWNLLSSAEKLALAQCSAFTGSFSIDAAEEILDLSSVAGAPPVLDALWALREKSLIKLEPGPSAGSRLSLYLSIRDFAMERLEQLEPGDATIARHARVHLDTGLARAAALRRRADEGAREALELDQTQLVSVFDRGTSRSNPVWMADALACLEPLFSMQGRTAELATRAALVVPLATSDRLDLSRRARLYVTLGTCVGLEGRLTESLSLLEHARELADQSADVELAGEARAMLAVRYRQAGRYHEALATASAARDLLARVDAPRSAGFNLACRGLLLAEMQRDEEARAQDEEARAIFRTLRDRWAEGLVLGNLAQLDQLAGDIEGARAQYQEAIDAFASHGDELYEGMYQGRLATLEHETGELEAARRRYLAALERVQHARANHLEGLLRAYLGALEARAGRRREATDQLARARALLEGVRAPSYLATLDAHVGQLDLLDAREAFAARDADRAEAAMARAAQRLAAATANACDVTAGAASSEGVIAEYSQDLRIATRMLRRALDDTIAARSARQEPVPGREAPPSTARALVVGSDAFWLTLPDGTTISMLRRGPLRKVLEVLVTERLSAPGRALTRDALLAAGWPGERILVEAGAKRVRSAVATLRRLGLASLLLTRADGYLLDPEAAVVRG